MKMDKREGEFSINQPLIIIAGATGDLGGRIVRELSLMKAKVRALVRSGTPEEKKRLLRDNGVEIFEVDYSDHRSLVHGCHGGSVVVSTLSGLREVMISAQTQLLNAAVEAQVQRFFPSDFAIDFTKIPAGTNRNLNFRSEFQKIADQADIQVISILNGAFSDMLAGVAPFVLYRIRRVLCWGNPDQLMDWTTMDDTARYTAYAALDPGAPRFLKIAGDQQSSNSLAETMTKLSGEEYKVLRPGGLGLLSLLIAITKRLSPGTEEVFPTWQGMQYMRDQFQGLAKFDRLDNDRYPIRWTKTKDVLAAHLKK